jgi:hypothetical protein
MLLQDRTHIRMRVSVVQCLEPKEEEKNSRSVVCVHLGYLQAAIVSGSVAGRMQAKDKLLTTALLHLLGWVLPSLAAPIALSWQPERSVLQRTPAVQQQQQ